MGGAVLVGLLLLLALVIGPRDGVRMPDEGGGSKVPTAKDAPQPAGNEVAAFSDQPGNEAQQVSAPEWTPPGAASRNEPESTMSRSRMSGGTDTPDSSTPRAAVPEPGVADETSQPAARPAVDSAPAGQWAVQVGSFTVRANADRLSQWCRQQGHGVKVVTRAGDKLYRVHVGPYASRSDADSTVAELALQGRKGFITGWEESSR